MGVAEALAFSTSLQGRCLSDDGVTAALRKLRAAPGREGACPCMAVAGRRVPRAAAYEHTRQLRLDATGMRSSTGSVDYEETAATLALLDLPSRSLTDLAQDIAATGVTAVASNAGTDSPAEYGAAEDGPSNGAGDGAGSLGSRMHASPGAAGGSSDRAATAEAAGPQTRECSETDATGASGTAGAAELAGPQRRERSEASSSFPWLGWQRTRRGGRAAGERGTPVEGYAVSRGPQTDGMSAAAALAHSQSEAGVVREVQPGGAASSAWPRLKRRKGMCAAAARAHSHSAPGVVREVQLSGAASSAWPRLKGRNGMSAAAALAHLHSEAGVVREVQPGGAASSAWPRMRRRRARPGLQVVFDWLQQRLPGRMRWSGGGGGGQDYVRIDFRAQPRTPVNPFKPSSWPQLEVDVGTFWGLLVLSLAYVHHSTTGFALPALLPLISPDLQLTDNEGALLTVGYTVLYAIALIPAGFLADKTDRPRMLAAGLALWSLLTMAASKVTNFSELLALRVGFAAAQATQNPICFSLIPELFPAERTTAMAAYNSAIYMGRALSFAAVIIAGQLGVTHSTSESIGVQLVPLSAVDLSHVSILYTMGEMAAITPIYDYNFQVVFTELAESSWRTLLFWLGPPGLAVACLALLTLAEPRKASQGLLGQLVAALRAPFNRPPAAAPAAADAAEPDPSRTLNRVLSASARRAERKAAAALAAAEEEKRNSDMWASVRKLVKLPSFQAVTAAAAANDVGSWALISFQATFYSRVYELGPEVYAPALAAILPIGGVLGGVGGGLAGDWLSRNGGRAWLTAGATIAAAPVLVANLLAPEYHQSLAALLVGFALSEMWRAPAAIMIRDVSPPNLGSTGSAVHLCARNLIGGLGPLAVAGLEEKVGLQQAMLIVPFMYLLSGIGFFFAEKIVASEKAAGSAADPAKTSL